MEKHGAKNTVKSTAIKLIALATFDHGLCIQDDEKLYHLFHAAFRGSSAVSVLTGSVKNQKQGQEAFLQGVSTYGGRDKWETIVNNAEAVLHNDKYNGTMKYIPWNNILTSTRGLLVSFNRQSNFWVLRYQMRSHGFLLPVTVN